MTRCVQHKRWNRHGRITKVRKLLAGDLLGAGGGCAGTSVGLGGGSGCDGGRGGGVCSDDGGGCAGCTAGGGGSGAFDNHFASPFDSGGDSYADGGGISVDGGGGGEAEGDAFGVSDETQRNSSETKRRLPAVRFSRHTPPASSFHEAEETEAREAAAEIVQASSAFYRRVSERLSRARSSQGVEVLVAPCANSSDVIEACSPNLVEASSASFVEDEPVGVPDLEAASSSAAESSSVMSSSMRQLDV